MRWVVLGLGVLFVGVGLLASWFSASPSAAPTPAPIAEARVAETLAQPPARTVADEVQAKRPEPTPPPTPTRTAEPSAPVAKAPPPLPPVVVPKPEAPQPRPLPPAATQIVWADDVKQRLSREKLQTLREEANRLPDDATPEQRAELAGQLRALGQNDVQLQVLAGGVRSDPEAIGPRVAYGAALMRQRLWTQAITQWRAVLAREDTHPYAWHNLALALQESGALLEARTAWDRSLELAPDNLDGYAQRGVLLLQLEQHEAALSDFAHVLANEESAPDALLNGALAALHSGRYQMARDWGWQAARAWQDRPALVVTAVERLLQTSLLSEQRDLEAEQLGYQMLNEQRGSEEIRDLLRQLREANR